MSCIPDSNKHLESFNAIAQAAHYTVKNIKEGLDNFQSTIIQFNQGLNQPVVKMNESGKQTDNVQQPPETVVNDSSAGN
jgi:hypothetical protein